VWIVDGRFSFRKAFFLSSSPPPRFRITALSPKKLNRRTQ
jgi:hypothetical protein